MREQRRAPSVAAWSAALTMLAVSVATFAGPAGSTPDPEPPLPPGQGDFRMEDFATEEPGNGNFVTRGYLFRPARDVTITGLWGGSGPNCSTGFHSGIWRAEIVDESGASGGQPSFRLLELLRQVEFTRFEAAEPEFVAFEGEATLGGELELQADTFYVIAQGRTGSSGSGCHYMTEGLDPTNLLLGSAIIGEWYPDTDGKFNLGGSGSSALPINRAVGATSPVITNARFGGPRVLIGFRYLTAIVAATFNADATLAVQEEGENDDGTFNVQLSGELADSGVPPGAVEGDETTLFFEVSTNESFSGATSLLPATPPDVTGSQTDLPFNRTVEGLAAGSQRWFRPVAINESGRSEGDAQSFTVGSMPVGVEVTRDIAPSSDSGDVRPSGRSVVVGETTTFLAIPDAGSEVSATTTCAGSVSRSGNTFTIGPVEQSCNVTFTFTDASSEAPSPQPAPPPPSPPSPAADPDGGVPTVAPGRATGSVGGAPVEPAPSRPSDGAAEFRAGTVKTRVDVAVAGAGAVDGSDGAPVIRAVRDRVATISGGGMRPGDIAEVWMPLPEGGSRQVALLPIGADGTFDGALPFTGELDGRGPLPIGDRTIQLFGRDADGQLTVINFGVRVEQPAPLTPEPDRGRGVVPTLSPGQSLATNAGLPTPVTVTPLPDVRSTRIEGDGWLMDVDVPDGEVRDDGGAPLIEIVNGTDSIVRGTGFMAGTRAYVWLMSDPTFLGEVTVNADGSFSGAVPIAGVEPGEHTLQLSGVGTDGFIRAANLGVVLIGDGTPVPRRIDAGGGPVPLVPLSMLLAVALLGAVALTTERGRDLAAIGAAEHSARLHANARHRLPAFDTLQQRLTEQRRALRSMD